MGDPQTERVLAEMRALVSQLLFKSAELIDYDTAIAALESAAGTLNGEIREVRKNKEASYE